MGAFFGLLTSFSITSAEFFARRVTNEIGPIVAASAVAMIAALTTIIVAIVADGALIARDMWLGAGSGVGFGLGMATYLQGVRVSSSAVVGPISASLSALIPFGWAAATGSAPALLGYLGAAAAIVGLVFVTVGGSAGSNVFAGAQFGSLSGIGYGVGTIFLFDISDAAGQWPLAAQRTVGMVAIFSFALLRRRPLLPPREFASLSATAGALSGLSSILLLAGLSANPAAASVTASLFPATSVAAGRMFFGDAVSRTQLLGLVVVIVGTVAIVLG